MAEGKVPEPKKSKLTELVKTTNKTSEFKEPLQKKKSQISDENEMKAANLVDVPKTRKALSNRNID